MTMYYKLIFNDPVAETAQRYSPLWSHYQVQGMNNPHTVVLDTENNLEVRLEQRLSQGSLPFWESLFSLERIVWFNSR